MEAAANGSKEAIDTLRDLASENLIVNLDVQNISAEDKDYLINQELLPMLHEFQGVLDAQEIGFRTTADVDTTGFIAKLNQLLEFGQITAEQATNILSSVGMDADIGTETKTSKQHHEAWYPTFS